MNDQEAFERIRQHIPHSYIELDGRTLFYFESEYKVYQAKNIEKALPIHEWYHIWVEKIRGKQ